MKLEKLNLSNSKGKIKIAFASGCLITILLIVLVNIIASKALYRKTESVQLASGTVNYVPYDFKIMAMYQETSTKGQYEEISIMPSSEYVINETKSYCTLDNQKHDDNAILKTFEGRHIISHLTKQDKCYLYFDREPSAASKTVFSLGLKTEGAIDKITGPSCSDNSKCGTNNMSENGLYYAGEDDDGPSYVYRGTIDNNWVKFGKTSDNQDIWWRILRINGNGSIRLIYAGVGSIAPINNGENVINSQVYNAAFNDNTYVGFYNQNDSTNAYPEAHQGTNPSDIAKQLNTWFTSTKLDETPYINEIDENAGFCNDREKSIVQHGLNFTNEGYGKTITWYAPFDRVAESDSSSSYSSTEQKPVLKCANKGRDLYTTSKSSQGNKILIQPIGLITADEVILAGGFAGKNNTGYWLYTGSAYWTMSPYDFSGVYAQMFVLVDSGYLGSTYVSNNNGVGARPVINLKPDNVTLREPSSANKGTTSNPYIVSD